MMKGVYVAILAVPIITFSFVKSALAGESNDIMLARVPGASQPPEMEAPRAKPSKGKFLVASRYMNDTHFEKTVILLIDYDLTGASGLIINRPTNMKLDSAFPHIERLKDMPAPLYYGGPVAITEMRVLMRADEEHNERIHVFDDIYVSSSRAVLESMLDRDEGGARFRVYAGYSGWGAGQLDREILRNSWYIMDADGSMIFDRTNREIWPELIRQSSASQ